MNITFLTSFRILYTINSIYTIHNNNISVVCRFKGIVNNLTYNNISKGGNQEFNYINFDEMSSLDHNNF